MGQQEGSAAAMDGRRGPGAKADPSEYCPNCSAKLEPSSSRLKCAQCGFYLSGSDY